MSALGLSWICWSCSRSSGMTGRLSLAVEDPGTDFGTYRLRELLQDPVRCDCLLVLCVFKGPTTVNVVDAWDGEFRTLRISDLWGRDI